MRFSLLFYNRKNFDFLTILSITFIINNTIISVSLYISGWRMIMSKPCYEIHYGQDVMSAKEEDGQRNFLGKSNVYPSRLYSLFQWLCHENVISKPLSWKSLNRNWIILWQSWFLQNAQATLLRLISAYPQTINLIVRSL